MEEKKVIAGTKVTPGVYRCNACANQIETSGEGSKLPSCSVCDSISWRVCRLTGESSKEKCSKDESSKDK